MGLCGLTDIEQVDSKILYRRIWSGCLKSFKNRKNRKKSLKSSCFGCAWEKWQILDSCRTHLFFTLKVKLYLCGVYTRNWRCCTIYTVVHLHVSYMQYPWYIAALCTAVKVGTAVTVGMTRMNPRNLNIFIIKG
jgi:hypothetical protein